MEDRAQPHRERDAAEEEASTRSHAADGAQAEPHEPPADPLHPNPPHTTTDGWLTTPEFGAAGSGGAELEPGPEKD